MAMDPVPWFIGGGAQHSPEVARMLAYAATGGAEGVVNVADLKVTALGTPGAAVQAAPGGALIRNRASGGATQSYVARNVSATQVAVAATGSAGGRSDLVVVQVEDPYMPGEPWQDPADPAAGPYAFIRVIPNVPAGTRRLQDVAGYAGRSAETLARIDIPASTATITNAMITDLRNVALPRREHILRIATPPANRKVPTGYVWTNWPTAVNEILNIDVPSWATQAQVLVHISSVGARGNTWGELRTLFGTTQVATGTWDTTVETTSDPFQIQMMMAGIVTIPSALRGTSVSVAIDARTSSNSADNTPWTTPATRVALQVEFNEVPE